MAPKASDPATVGSMPPPPPPPPTQSHWPAAPPPPASGSKTPPLALILPALMVFLGAVIGVVLLTSGGSGHAHTTPSIAAAQVAETTPPPQETTPTQPTFNEAQARSAIVTTLQSYESDYSSANLGGLSELFTANVERHGLAAGGCASVHGKPAVLAAYRSQFASDGPVGYQLQNLSPSDISFPNDESAQVSTSYLIASSHNSGSVAFTFTDQGGSWLIAKIDATCHPTY